MAASATVTRSVPAAKQPRNPISRKQVELVASRSVAGFGLVFGAQTVPWLLGQLDEAHPIWLSLTVPAVFGSLILVLIASFAKVWVRPAHGLAAIVYLVSLATWPLGVLSVDAVFPGIHWLYYLLTVATATATIAFSSRIAALYLFAAPIAYFIVRITPFGGSADWQLAALETVYAIILGSAVVIIITMLRQASSSVDSAQATALDRYSHAIRQHATEVERVQVDSIVHDSVLTTLISAARAFTPEAMKLAATMAGSAIGHLREAALATPDDGSTVRLSSVSSRIVEAAGEMPRPFEVKTSGVGTRSAPSVAADAVTSAAIQAMFNSLQHGGEREDIRRWVTVRRMAPAGIHVEVGDTGDGFDMSAIPLERLGVRVSIIERVAGAGGLAEITTKPGGGTVVTIRWPAPSVSDDRESDFHPQLVSGAGKSQ